MQLGSFTFLQRFRSARGYMTNDWLIVAYHPRTSLTWRFVAWWRQVPRNVRRGFSIQKRNTGTHVHCDLWILGRVGFDIQRRIEDVRAIIDA